MNVHLQESEVRTMYSGFIIHSELGLSAKKCHTLLFLALSTILVEKYSVELFFFFK